MAEIDSLEDVLLEVIAEQDADMSPGMQRVVVAIASGALRKAEDEGRLRSFFGAAAPVESDLRELAAKIMARIDGDGRPELEAECVDFVFGLGLNGGKSQTEIAAEHGVGRACVSARCIGLREEFGRPPARGMKTDKARQSYRDRELKKAREPKEPWGFGGLLTGIFGKGLAHAGA